MSRPKPKILLQITDNDKWKSDQVLASEGIWAVFYEGDPINLKTIGLLAGSAGPKYKKVSFSNSGHAINLAKKLNKVHKTSSFEVFKLTHGEKIS